MDIELLAEMEPWEWPEGAKEAILGAMTDREGPEDTRLIAAQLAGDFSVVDDEIVEVLLCILQDERESDEMRGRAAISFGPALEQAYTEEFIDPEDVPIGEDAFHRIQETLERMYADSSAPKLVRRRILEAAVRAPQDWVKAAVGAAYRSGDAEWVLTGVFCMQYVRGYETEILEALDSPDAMIHYHAVCAAGNWAVKGAWKHVRALVDDDDPDLRLAAIEAATAIRPKEAREFLVDYIHDEDEDVAEAARFALELGDAMDEMPEAFPDEDDEDDR